jgi:hypothetical protein
MPVEIAPACHRTLAADIEGGERVHLPGVGLADDHAELLAHGRIGGGRLHAPVFERRPFIPVEIGQHRGGLDGLRWKPDRLLTPHRTRRLRHRVTILGHEQARDTVEGAHARKVLLHDGKAGRLAVPDRAMQLVDGRFFQAERFGSSHAVWLLALCVLRDAAFGGSSG